MIKNAISKVVLQQDLVETEMIEVMNQIMGGEATQAQVGAFITALRMKGETVEEITGAARVMRDHATPIRVGKALDIDREEINLDRETILDVAVPASKLARYSLPVNPLTRLKSGFRVLVQPDVILRELATEESLVVRPGSFTSCLGSG